VIVHIESGSIISHKLKSSIAKMDQKLKTRWAIWLNDENPRTSERITRKAPEAPNPDIVVGTPMYFPELEVHHYWPQIRPPVIDIYLSKPPLPTPPVEEVEYTWDETPLELNQDNSLPEESTVPILVTPLSHVSPMQQLIPSSPEPLPEPEVPKKKRRARKSEVEELIKLNAAIHYLPSKRNAKRKCY
jgi:hypothetical protein